MKRGELKRELGRRKKALKAQLALARREARARVAVRDDVRRLRRRKRVKQAVGLAIVIALLLMIRCDCGRAPAVAAGDPLVTDGGPKRAGAPVRAPGAMVARVERQPRGAFTARAQEAAGWLDEFRLQVAARSPRLARCFTGTDRPGALRWSVALNPTSGAVSDHEFELVGPDPGLQKKQRECVEQVLSSPSYKLVGVADEVLARRVSMVIEF